MNVDWTEAEVRQFIAEQINYYGFEVTPAETKCGVSPWKLWLWLERHGYDFAYQSLEREINEFRLYKHPSGVSLRSERRLLVRIRNVMRKILDLPSLSADEERAILDAVPVSNWTHWASIPHKAEAEAEPFADFDTSDIVDFIWTSLKSDNPGYVSLMKRVRDYDDSARERFSDEVTINGSYDLMMHEAQKQNLYYMIAQHHVLRSFDMTMVPGHMKPLNTVWRDFAASIPAALRDGDSHAG
jgi:hypothetical protein